MSREEAAVEREGVALTTAPMGRPLPFRPDALVREEDTHLVLSAGRLVRPPREPTGLLRHRLDDWEPLEPGSVSVRPGWPPDLLAVVHDLDRRPTWREAWVASALDAVLGHVAERGVRDLALPVLGAVHGDLGPFRFLRLLRSAVTSRSGSAPDRICVRVPRGVDPRDARGLEEIWRGGRPGRAGVSPPRTSPRNTGGADEDPRDDPSAMICRVWHGWTSPEDADAYERLLRGEILPGIAGRAIAGYGGAHLLRRSDGEEVEFVTLLWFDSLDAVREFAGEEHEGAVVPPAARELLSRFDRTSRHYETIRAPGQGDRPAAGR